MSEAEIVELVQRRLAELGVEDQVRAAGEFMPRGSTAGGFAGGLLGDEVAGPVGMAAGVIGGGRVAGASSGLPPFLVVAVSDGAVYGFGGRRTRPGELVFRVPRSGLQAAVHQRVNVRILELISADGSRIELEGSRVPLTHSKDVISLLAP